jgi:hypothetical protein
MHLVIAFTQIQIKKILSKYILKRYSRDARSIGTGMTLSGEVGMEVKKGHGSQS